MLEEVHDLDAEDLRFLTALASDSEAAQFFWTTCFVLQPLVNFGHNVLVWLHSCCCGCDSKTSCPLKGRRSIELACGQVTVFLKKLEAVHLSKWAIEAHTKLFTTDPGRATNLLNDWKTAKAKIHLRMKQSFGFWEQLPWSILRVGECLVVKDESCFVLQITFSL